MVGGVSVWELDGLKRLGDDFFFRQRGSGARVISEDDRRVVDDNLRPIEARRDDEEDANNKSKTFKKFSHGATTFLVMIDISFFTFII